MSRLLTSFMFHLQLAPFDLSGLSDYTVENKDVLISSIVTGAKTADLITREGNVRTGIKTSEKIGVFDTDAVLQDGDGCGFNASGTTAITQREITVGTIKVNDQLCLDDLNKKYTQLLMQKGTSQETLPKELEGKYVDRKAEKIAQKMEKLIWQGNTALTGDADLKWIDGFLKLLDTSVGAIAVNAKRGTGTITASTGSATVTGSGTSFSSQVAVGDKIYAGGVVLGTVSAVGSNTSLTLAANSAAAATGAAFTIAPVAVTSPIAASAGITLSNVTGIMRSVYLGIPEAVLESDEPTYIFVGHDVARLHLQALSDADLFNYSVDGKELRDGYYIPGTDIKVMPLPGLTGTNRIVAAQTSNMYLGTDLENEWEAFDMWFSKDDDVLKFKAKWRIGVQWGFPSQVTHWMAAA